MMTNSTSNIDPSKITLASVRKLMDDFKSSDPRTHAELVLCSHLRKHPIEMTNLLVNAIAGIGSIYGATKSPEL